MRTAAWLGLAIAVFGGHNTMAQQTRPSVEVVHGGSDATGRALAFRLEEEIDRGASLKRGPVQKSGYSILLSTMGTDYALKSVTIYQAVVLEVDGTTERKYVGSVIGYCPEGEAASCAPTIYEDLAPRIKRWEESRWTRAILDAAGRRRPNP